MLDQSSDKSISIRPREIYGNKVYYPDCDDSRLFTELTRRKTFNKNDLRVLRELGYSIEMAYYDED